MGEKRLKELLKVLMEDPNMDLNFFKGLKREKPTMEEIIKRAEVESNKPG